MSVGRRIGIVFQQPLVRIFLFRLAERLLGLRLLRLGAPLRRAVRAGILF